jgi:hypothetical protein
MMTNIKEDIPFYLSIAAIVVLFFIVEYNLLSKGFFALSADESGHTLEAFDWIKNDGQLFSIWLPFHKVINGFALKIHYDLLVTPRIVSGLFGLLTLLSTIFLSYQLFENRITSILTGFLAAIFLPIAMFSILPLIEIYFFFFIITSLSFFILWLKSEKNIFLWLTIGFSAIGTTTRYEAWIFAFVIYVMITFQLVISMRTRSHKIFLSAVIGIIIAVFPLFWAYLSFITNQNTSGFVSSVTGRYCEGKVFAEIKNNVLYQFLIINITSLNIIGIAPLIHLTKINSNIKKYSIILFGTMILFSVLSFIIKAMPTHNYWRIAMIWSLLLIPFTAYWLHHLIDVSKNSPINKYAFIIFFFILTYFFNSQTSKYSSVSYLTMDDINVGKFLNKISLGENSKIYVMKDGSDKWRYANILVTSQKPELFVTDLKNFSYVSSDTVTIDQKLVAEMVNRKIEFVLMPSRKIVNDDTGFLIEQKVFGKWKIYKFKM